MLCFKLSKKKSENTILLEKVFEELLFIKQQNQKIMTTQKALAEQLSALALLIGGLLPAIQAMETALANQSNVEPELQDAFDGLKTQVGALSTLVNPPADAPPADGGTPPADGTPAADGSAQTQP